MLIELRDIVLQHEDHSILKGVNFCVDDNDFIYIIGKVGSGKTSLLRILTANCLPKRVKVMC